MGLPVRTPWLHPLFIAHLKVRRDEVVRLWHNHKDLQGWVKHTKNWVAM
jgi:hypothetical protein